METCRITGDGRGGKRKRKMASHVQGTVRSKEDEDSCPDGLLSDVGMEGDHFESIVSSSVLHTRSRVELY